MARRIALFSLSLVSALALSGCPHSFTPLATQAISPGTSADVVWVLRDGDRVFRCVDMSDGPRCSEAHISTR